MKALFSVGLVLLVLGILSFFVPIPRNETHGVKAADVKISVEVHRSEHVSPIVSAFLILSGAGLMVAGSRRKTR